MELVNLKDRYPFQCACGVELSVQPSMAMQLMQWNQGMVRHGSCPQVFVRIDDENDRMLSTGDNMHEGQLPPSCYWEATPAEVAEIESRKV